MKVILILCGLFAFSMVMARPSSKSENNPTTNGMMDSRQKRQFYGSYPYYNPYIYNPYPYPQYHHGIAARPIRSPVYSIPQRYTAWDLSRRKRSTNNNHIHSGTANNDNPNNVDPESIQKHHITGLPHYTMWDLSRKRRSLNRPKRQIYESDADLINNDNFNFDSPDGNPDRQFQQLLPHYTAWDLSRKRRAATTNNNSNIKSNRVKRQILNEDDYEDGDELINDFQYESLQRRQQPVYQRHTAWDLSRRKRNIVKRQIGDTIFYPDFFHHFP